MPLLYLVLASSPSRALGATMKGAILNSWANPFRNRISSLYKEFWKHNKEIIEQINTIQCTYRKLQNSETLYLLFLKTIGKFLLFNLTEPWPLSIYAYTLCIYTLQLLFTDLNCVLIMPAGTVTRKHY